MAGAPGGVRRPFPRADFEAAVLQVEEGRPLPSIYLRVPAADDGAPRYVAGHILMCRLNGFMVILPDVPLVGDMLSTLVTADGVPLSLTLQVELACETMRGRQLGVGSLLLLDLPWESLEHFARNHPFRAALAGEGAQRLTVLQVDGTSARPRSAEALAAARAWVDDLDPETAQEYYSAAEPAEAEDEDEAAEPIPEPAGPANRRPVTPVEAAMPSARPAPSRQAHGLFNPSPGLSADDWATLRRLAGAAPTRTGRVEQAQLPDPAVGLQLESEFEALPPADVVDPQVELPLTGTSMEMLLLASLRQNAVLLEKISGSSRSQDTIQDALGGPGSASDSSSGIKGHLAREAFLKQVGDLKRVSRAVESNALLELGLSSSEPGLMKTYVSQRVPFAEHRMLGHVAAIAAAGWETGHRTDNEDLKGFCSRLLVFTEQAALDSGRLSLAWLLAGYPDPAPQMWQVRRAPGLKPFSRLCAPQWLAANLAYLKDLDYAETRMAQIGSKTQGRGQQPTAEEKVDLPEPEKPRRPRRPNRQKGGEAPA